MFILHTDLNPKAGFMINLEKDARTVWRCMRSICSRNGGGMDVYHGSHSIALGAKYVHDAFPHTSSTPHLTNRHTENSNNRFVGGHNIRVVLL